jgi:quercetin dioxygenase-like cupin family protein
MNSRASAGAILHPDELPVIDRGHGARTIPLVTRHVCDAGFLNGITEFDPGASIDLHRHNCIESAMVIEGAAIVEIDGVETSLSAHDITCVPANVPHRFKNASQTARMRIFWTYPTVDATRTPVASGVEHRIDSEHAAAVPRPVSHP